MRRADSGAQLTSSNAACQSGRLVDPLKQQDRAKKLRLENGHSDDGSCLLCESVLAVRERMTSAIRYSCGPRPSLTLNTLP